MAYIQFDNVKAHVKNATETEHAAIDAYLTFTDPNAKFSPAFQSNRWDGKVRIYKRSKAVNPPSPSFPSGLVSLVADHLKSKGFAVTLADRRPGRMEPDPTVECAWLSEDRQQPQTLEACLRETRGVIKAPTGSGKGESIVALVSAIPCRWLILVDMKDGMVNLASRLASRTGEAAGLIGDGKFTPGRVTIAMFQTLARRIKEGSDQRVLDLLKDVGGVITDEVHVLPAATWTGVMDATVNAYWRFGFSATPLYGDARQRLSVIGQCGPQIFEVSAEALLKAGALSRHTIKMVPFRQKPVDVDPDDLHAFGQVYRQAVVENGSRNHLILDIVRKAPKPCLVLVSRVEHGRLLMDSIRQAGIKTTFLSGENSSPQRQQVVKDLQRGDIDVLVGSGIFNKAWDIPALASAINAGAGKSIKDSLQKLGRVMRTSEGKGTAEFFDIHDLGIKTLEKQAEQRREAYQLEGYNVADTQLTLIG